MMKLVKYLLVLVVLLALAVILTPLNLYYSNIKQYFNPLSLNGISGSLIKGHANNAKYIGLDLGELSWLVYPSSYDELTVNFDVTSELYDFQGLILQSQSSQKIENLRGTLDWKQIEKFVRIKYGEISGYLSFDMQEIEILNNQVNKIIGKVITKDLKLISPLSKDLGEIEIVFKSDFPEIVVGQINSNSNTINVSGAVYIHKSHKWEVKLTIIPMAGEYELEYMLQGIGDKRPGGGRTLNLAGFY